MRLPLLRRLVGERGNRGLPRRGGGCWAPGLPRSCGAADGLFTYPAAMAWGLRPANQQRGKRPERQRSARLRAAKPEQAVKWDVCAAPRPDVQPLADQTNLSPPPCALSLCRDGRNVLHGHALALAAEQHQRAAFRSRSRFVRSSAVSISERLPR